MTVSSVHGKQYGTLVFEQIPVDDADVGLIVVRPGLRPSESLKAAATNFTTGLAGRPGDGPF